MLKLSLLLWLYAHINVTLLYAPSPTMGFNGITTVSYTQSYNQSLNQFLKYGLDVPNSDKTDGMEISFRVNFK